MHIYETFPKYSNTGMPVSEYAQAKAMRHIVDRLDWTSSRRKSKEERVTLINAKNAHKKFSRNPYFKEYRNELIKALINHNAPNFGSFRLIIN